MNKSYATTDHLIVIDRFGSKRWYKKGNLYNEFHREDGPAFEGANGDKEYWINDQLHREDGPAIIYKNGSKFWYVNGNIHREDGPAIEYADGSVEYWINGINYSSLDEGLMDQAIG